LAGFPNCSARHVAVVDRLSELQRQARCCSPGYGDLHIAGVDRVAGAAAPGTLLLFLRAVQDHNGVWTTPGGDSVAWFTDPGGNNLSLTQFTYFVESVSPSRLATAPLRGQKHQMRGQLP
jgi:hypothetical protein